MSVDFPLFPTPTSAQTSTPTVGQAVRAGGVPMSNVAVIPAPQRRVPQGATGTESGDWSIVNYHGAPVARADSRAEGVRLMGWIAARGEQLLPLRLLGPGAQPTGDRIG